MGKMLLVCPNLSVPYLFIPLFVYSDTPFPDFGIYNLQETISWGTNVLVIRLRAPLQVIQCLIAGLILPLNVLPSGVRPVYPRPIFLFCEQVCFPLDCIRIK